MLKKIALTVLGLFTQSLVVFLKAALADYDASKDKKAFIASIGKAQIKGWITKALTIE